jgi:maltose alpha-D-glucosyltransferase/alpha-amylase
VHPEIEVGRFLLETDFHNAPDLLGWAELVEGDRRSAIAVVHRFVENQGDAWTVSAAYLDRFIDEQRYLSGETAAGSAELASYLQRVQTIGTRTAEMLRALASRNDLPDFAPEPVTAADTAAWTQRLLASSSETFGMLRPRLDELPDYARPAVEAMLKRADAIAAHIESLLPAKIGVPKIRHHGDFHLGQVLIARDDVFILDFEGEPGRPLEQRREKAPAARDVAGLIRSIDYSATSALIRAGTLTDDERAALQPQLATWRERATGAFWSAVRAVPDDGLWPDDEDAANRLLDFFLLEKAFYEIQYELNNRPSWLHVPLDGAWRILLDNGVVKP